jgi:hypothetical protein
MSTEHEGEVAALPQPPKTHEIKTTAQVERTYTVEGENEEQAYKRLRTWLADREALRPGLVQEKNDEQRDSKPQRVTAINGKPVSEVRGTLTAEPEKPAEATTNGASAEAKPTRRRRAASKEGAEA